jgi:DNA-directed RNA polymerase subunit RPC12/RpoP
MNEKRKETQTCSVCKKDFMLVWTTYISKLDDKREGYYNCPYCNTEYSVRLLGNEEVESEKIV